MVPDHWSNDAMVSMDRCGLNHGDATALSISGCMSENLTTLLVAVTECYKDTH